MAIIEKTKSHAALAEADRLSREALDKLTATIKAEFPVGSAICWQKHGAHVQTGRVTKHGVFNRLAVINDNTGSLLWIDSNHVLAAYRLLETA